MIEHHMMMMMVVVVVAAAAIMVLGKEVWNGAAVIGGGKVSW